MVFSVFVLVVYESHITTKKGGKRMFSKYTCGGRALMIAVGILMLGSLLANGAGAYDSYEFVLKIPSTQQWYFGQLFGVAVDSSGNVYVADSDNDRIQKFSSSGSLLSGWGSLAVAMAS